MFKSQRSFIQSIVVSWLQIQRILICKFDQCISATPFKSPGKIAFPFLEKSPTVYSISSVLPYQPQFQQKKTYPLFTKMIIDPIQNPTQKKEGGEEIIWHKNSTERKYSPVFLGKNPRWFAPRNVHLEQLCARNHEELALLSYLEALHPEPRVWAAKSLHETKNPMRIDIRSDENRYQIQGTWLLQKTAFLLLYCELAWIRSKHLHLQIRLDTIDSIDNRQHTPRKLKTLTRPWAGKVGISLHHWSWSLLSHSSANLPLVHSQTCQWSKHSHLCLPGKKKRKVTRTSCWKTTCSYFLHTHSHFTKNFTQSLESPPKKKHPNSVETEGPFFVFLPPAW